MYTLRMWFIKSYICDVLMASICGYMQEEFNILQNLSLDEFTIVRGLVIDMVLATDMSGHFEQLKQMRLLLSDR